MKRNCAISLITAVSLLLVGYASADSVEIRQENQVIQVLLGGKLFTEYHYADADRPYFYPLITSTGENITRNWPMQNINSDEEHDHPHHRSLWFTHGDVNGYDFWSEGKGPKIIQTKLEFTAEGDSGVIICENEWRTKDGQVVCTDVRKHTIRTAGENRIIDFEITIKASHGKVVLGDTKEGSMAVRVAAPLRMSGKVAGGSMVNSDGLSGKKIWGTRAKWCDYYGALNGNVVGIAIMDNPSNPRHPTWWHARDYGLCTANPFGISSFDKKPANSGNMEIVALCDADQEHVNGAAKKLGDKADSVMKYTDMRKVFEDKSIDAIATATPNHWHALTTIWALQAGKHVYVEKPVCHNIFEGQMMIKAAQKYGKIVQAGFQNRSDIGLLEFFPWLHEGNLGKIEMLYGQCFRNRFSIGARRKEPLTPPDSLDFNLWLGPADDLPIYRNKLHYDWHWVWNTGNGDMGNQGPHELDLMQWARGDGALPKRVMSFGERFGWEDAGETPNLQFASFDYGDYPCYFEVRDLCMNPDSKEVAPRNGLRVGLYVKCEKGCFKGGRGGGKAYDNDGKTIRQFKGDGGGGHQRNFIDAVKANKPEMLHSQLEDAVKSSDLAHMANAAWRVGQKANAAEIKENIKGNDVAHETLELFEKNLADWKIDTNKDKYVMGTWLDFDPENESFKGGKNYEEANKLLTRSYRKEFVVSETV